MIAADKPNFLSPEWEEVVVLTGNMKEEEEAWVAIVAVASAVVHFCGFAPVVRVVAVTPDALIVVVSELGLEASVVVAVAVAAAVANFDEH